MEHARERWDQLGLGELNITGPWFGYNLGAWTDEMEEEAALAVQGCYWETGERNAATRQKYEEGGRG